MLSDDSYLATLKPGIDDLFKEMLNHVKMIENDGPIQLERKIQSHEAKRRDPADTKKRTDWTPRVEADYLSYKAKVDVLKVAKRVQEASENVAKNNENTDIPTQEKHRNRALIDDGLWLDAAIE